MGLSMSTVFKHCKTLYVWGGMFVAYGLTTAWVMNGDPIVFSSIDELGPLQRIFVLAISALHAWKFDAIGINLDKTPKKKNEWGEVIHE